MTHKENEELRRKNYINTEEYYFNRSVIQEKAQLGGSSRRYIGGEYLALLRSIDNIQLMKIENENELLLLLKK